MNETSEFQPAELVIELARYQGQAHFGGTNGTCGLVPGNSRQPNLKALVGQFLDDLEAENRSPNTVRGYRADLAAFLAFHQGEAPALNADVLRIYFQTFKARSPATQARHRATLKSFLGWLAKQDILIGNPMDKLGTVRVPERQSRPLREEELATLLRSIQDRRDRLLFSLIAETGIRISEALGIRVEDIRLDAQEITVRGKGNRERTVYLVNTGALRLLRRYLKVGCFKEGLLFRPNENKQRSGRSIHYTTINEKWRKLCKEAGIKATIHQLRHTYATRLLAEGKDIQVVSKVLGHKKIATTQLYGQISDEAVKRALSDEGEQQGVVRL